MRRRRDGLLLLARLHGLRGHSQEAVLVVEVLQGLGQAIVRRGGVEVERAVMVRHGDWRFGANLVFAFKPV